MRNDNKMVLFQLKQLQPEITSLLTDAPQFGISSLEIHFMDGEIKRLVRHREESVVLKKDRENVQ